MAANENIDTARRSLLRQSVALAVSSGAAGVFPKGVLANDAVATDPLRDMIVINTLGALFDRFAPLTEEERRLDLTISAYTNVNSITARSLGAARASGMTAVNVTMGYLDGRVDPFEHTVREFGRWNRVFEKYPDELLLVRDTRDILRAKSEGKIGVIFGFQNGVMVGNDPSRVRLFADLGVRVFQMTYNLENQLGGGSNAPEDRGLTALGREVIAELNEVRVISDLSHSSRATCLDAVAVSKRPITISHTGCRALVDIPRHKSDEELRSVARMGGYIGIYFAAFVRLRKSGPALAEDVIAHIEHAVNVAGEDHVGIGTDGMILQISDMEEYRKLRRASLEHRRKAGIAAPAEAADDIPGFAVDLAGSEQFRKLADLLNKRGHSWTRIEKILGKNFMRVAREIWGN